jgi:hypothetical protein
MALKDEVQNRIPSARLVDLTRFKDESDNTVNDTLLTTASNDVEEYFEIHSGVAYDNTDSKHIALAVLGVVSILKLWNGMDANDEWGNWIQRVERFRITDGGNARIAPSSTSDFTPSGDRSGEVRPDFDKDSFTETRPNNPGRRMEW